jgi:adenine phosphoribosyltransferase
MSSGPSLLERLRAGVRDVPDFPKPGVVFKDITPLLGEAKLFAEALQAMAERASPLRPGKVVAIESRGFLFGGALANLLGVGLVPVRKPGKLPWRRVGRSYALEYGTDSLEMHEDALPAGERVLVVDDVIATGGTAKAVGELIESVGAQVAGFSFLIELAFLEGRAQLAPHTVQSLLVY